MIVVFFRGWYIFQTTQARFKCCISHVPNLMLPLRKIQRSRLFILDQAKCELLHSSKHGTMSPFSFFLLVKNDNIIIKNELNESQLQHCQCSQWDQERIILSSPERIKMLGRGFFKWIQQHLTGTALFSEGQKCAVNFFLVSLHISKDFSLCDHGFNSRTDKC